MYSALIARDCGGGEGLAASDGEQVMGSFLFPTSYEF